MTTMEYYISTLNFIESPIVYNKKEVPVRDAGYLYNEIGTKSNSFFIFEEKDLIEVGRTPIEFESV